MLMGGGGRGAFICVRLCGRDVCLVCMDVHVCLRVCAFAREIVTVVGEAGRILGWEPTLRSVVSIVWS